MVVVAGVVGATTVIRGVSEREKGGYGEKIKDMGVGKKGKKKEKWKLKMGIKRKGK